MIELLGAFIYRWRGMSHPYKKYFPRPFNQMVFALPFAYEAFIHTDILVALVVLALTTLGVLTGHGRGMSLNEPLTGKPETLEFLIRFLENKIPVYWYKVILLSITGLAITLPSGIVTLNPILALSGILKGPAYMLGHFGSKRGTESGELLTGAALWGIL